METKELKTLFEQVNRDFAEFRESNDKRLDAIEKDRGTADIEAKLERIDTAIDEAQKKMDADAQEKRAMQEQVEELEALLASGAVGEKTERKEVVQYRETFESWVRSCIHAKGGDPELQNALIRQEKGLIEIKAIQTTTGAAGGFAVPEMIGRQIADQVRLLSPMRDLCRVVQVGTPDYKELVNIHGESSGWVGETGTRSETNTPTFRERAPTKGTLYAYPQATEESLQDVFFNVGQMIVDVASTEFAIAESTAFLAGDGTNKPTGILNTAPVTTDDDASPARSAEAIEYVALDSASPTGAIDPDRLIDMVYLLRAPYRMGATWAMNSPVTGEVRKLKDGQSQYLWAPGLQPGQPASLLGYPVRTLEAMDDVSTVGNHPILFGNFARGYLVIDIAGLRMSIDDNITTPGYVKYYVRKRVGGILLDNNALKAGKWASS